MMGDNIIAIKNGKVVFSTQRSLENLNVHFTCGEINYLWGENGAGKSTIFDILSGNLSLASGEIVNPFLPQEIIYYPQIIRFSNLFTVQECLTYLNHFMRLEIAPPYHWDNEIQVLFDKIKNSFISKCSVGEIKIITLAFILAHTQAKLFLLDEPYAGLSETNRALLNRLISQQHQRQATFIIATHAKEDIIENAKIVSV